MQNEQVTPFQEFSNNWIDDLSATIKSASANAEQSNNVPAPDPAPTVQQKPTEEVNVKTEEPSTKVEEPEVKSEDTPVIENENQTEEIPVEKEKHISNDIKVEQNPSEEENVKKEYTPTTNTVNREMEFDDALAELEKELWIDIKEDEKDDDDTNKKDDKIEKTLDREQKFLKIIKELDTTNRESIKKADELEVKLENAERKEALYKQQAHDYLEQLNSVEFDKSRLAVDDKVKNFVHYFNEYGKDQNNSQAKNAALREAVKIVSSITGRDMSRYLEDYFSYWSTDLWEMWWGSSSKKPIFNKTWGGAKNDDSIKRAKLWAALENI